MKPRRVVAPHDASEIFDRAVRERALAILTLQDGNDWITFKSRFLERDRQGRFFVLDYDSPIGEALPPLSPGQYVGVSFRQKSRKILFATIVEAKGQFVLDDQRTIDAVRYRWPESMTELQRRSYYRTPVPTDMSLAVTLWAGGITGREQAGSAALSGGLADLSCGGAMVRLDRPMATPWAEEELLGVEVNLPDGRAPILVDARYRGGREEEPGRFGVAIQFVGLELTPDGQLVLERLAGCVQRLHRMGIASGRGDWNRKHKF